MQQLPLAQHGVGEVKPGELDLPRTARHDKLVEKPVVERTVILEFKGADGMGDPLDGVADAMGEVVHGVNAPRIAGAVVLRMQDTVDHRVPQVEIRGSHVDLGAKHARAVREFTLPHAFEEVQVLLYRTIAIRAVPARLGQGAAVFPNLVGGQIAYIRLSGLDEVYRVIMKRLEVIRGIEHPVVPVETEPPDILDDRVHILHFFLGGIRIVEPEIAQPVIIAGEAKIQADGLGVTDMEIAVGLGRKPGVDPAVVLSIPYIFVDDLADKIGRRGFPYIRSGGLALAHVYGIVLVGIRSIHSALYFFYEWIFSFQCFYR